MKRLLLRMLDTAGANNGDVPTYDSTTNRLRYAAPPTGSGGGGGSGTVLLDFGTSAPAAGTPVGTIVYRKNQSSTDVAAAIAADGPLAHLTLDETSGNWLDISGNARHFTPGAGVIRGLPPLASETGYSAAGSGTAAIGTYAATTGIASSGLASVEAVINMPSTNAHGSIAKVGTTNNGWSVGIGASADNVDGRQLMIARDGIAYLLTGYTIAAGIHRIIVTYDGTTFVVYVDGSQVFTGAGSINAAGAGLAIGQESSIFLSSTVSVDDVAFYNKVLTSARVAAHAGPIVNSGKALGWWDGAAIRALS